MSTIENFGFTFPTVESYDVSYSTKEVSAQVSKDIISILCVKDIKILFYVERFKESALIENHLKDNCNLNASLFLNVPGTEY